jgi:macrodomain Ter protein organizer (MatP/YcbG family)
MKTNILKSTIAVLLSTAALAIADEPGQNPKEDRKEPRNTSSATVTNTNGEVTIEIDVNGKKERKTFKLGEGEPFTWKIDNNGPKNSGKIDLQAAAAPGAKVGDLWRKGKAALAKHEKVTWLGVAAEPVGDDLRAQLPLQPGEGLAVRHVAPDGPAAKAGLEEHDILTRLDEQILVSGEQLSTLVKMHKPGDSVKLTYLHKGEKKDVTVSLIEHEAEPQDVLHWLGDGDAHRLWNMDIVKGTDRLRVAEDRLREMKEKLPGIIVDKKSFLVGPNGIIQKYTDRKAEELADKVREILEKAQITPEERKQLQNSIEEVVRNARVATEKAEEVLKRAKERAFDKSDQLPPPDKQP